MAKRIDEERIEADRMQDIEVLLERLVQHEATTARLIIDCLYDIGSVNLINHRVRYRSLNGIMKLVARTSKPIFRIFALRWFKRNCPRLIAKWLYTQVNFEGPSPSVETVVAEETSTPMPIAESAPSDLSQEIRRLRTQVKVLTGVLVGTALTVGAAVFWLGYDASVLMRSRRSPQFAPVEGVESSWVKECPSFQVDR